MRALVQACLLPHAGQCVRQSGQQDGRIGRKDDECVGSMLCTAFLDDDDWSVTVQSNGARLLEGHVMLVLPQHAVDRQPLRQHQVYEPTALVILGMTGIDAVRVPVVLLDPGGGRHKVEMHARVTQFGMTRVQYFNGGLRWATNGGTGVVRGDRGGPQAPPGTSDSAFQWRPRSRSAHRRHLGSGTASLSCQSLEQRTHAGLLETRAGTYHGTSTDQTDRDAEGAPRADQ